MKPTLFILCGLPGTGKTTYAKNIETKNCIRYSLDEFFLAKYKNVSLLPAEFIQREEEIKHELLVLVRNALTKGNSVILDYGFWKKDERDTYKKIAEECGVLSKLLYFKSEIDIQHTRLLSRETDKNHKITPELLSIFIGRFEEPNGEDEETIVS